MFVLKKKMGWDQPSPSPSEAFVFLTCTTHILKFYYWNATYRFNINLLVKIQTGRLYFNYVIQEESFLIHHFIIFMMNNQQLYPCQVDIQAGNGWWKLKAKSTAGLIFGLQNHFFNHSLWFKCIMFSFVDGFKPNISPFI